MPDAKLPAVPETILKKRKRQAESRALRAKAALANKIAKKVSEFFSGLLLGCLNEIRK